MSSGDASARLFSDLALSRRLERTEGSSCAQFAAARARLFPASGATWIECAGAYAVFDGIDSPVTQTFGLGLFEDASSEALDRIEEFFALAGRGPSTRSAPSPALARSIGCANGGTGPWKSARS